IPLKVIHINKSPVVLPVNAVTAAVAGRLSIDRERCERHWQVLCASPEAASKAAAVFAEPPPAGPQDPDLMLYSGGFFSPAERQQMQRVRDTDPWALGETAFAFQDPRLEEMLFRYRARSYPDTLSSEELARWEEYR